MPLDELAGKSGLGPAGKCCRSGEVIGTERMTEGVTAGAAFRETRLSCWFVKAGEIGRSAIWRAVAAKFLVGAAAEEPFRGAERAATISDRSARCNQAWSACVDLICNLKSYVDCAG